LQLLLAFVMTLAVGQKHLADLPLKITVFVWHFNDHCIWSKNTWPMDIRPIQLLFGTVMTLAFGLKHLVDRHLINTAFVWHCPDIW
jgi:hypothetical protein